MIKVGVQNFGPIASGAVTLRPLTIFVGANNTGKSYTARLVYALMQKFSRKRRFIGRTNYILNPLMHGAIRQKPFKISRASNSWLREKIAEGGKIKFGDLPSDFAEQTEERARAMIMAPAGTLTEELQRCFGSKIKELANVHAKSFQITLEEDNPPFSLELTSKADTLQATRLDLNLSTLEVDTRLIRPAESVIRPDVLSIHIARQVVNDFRGSVYYFPAARSGILQGHKLFASMLVSRLPLFGVEPFDIPKLSGEVADFIGNMLRLEKRASVSVPAKVARFIETRVCKGNLNLQAPRPRAEYPEVFYKTPDGKFPLHRISSMISELAPIVVFLKNLVDVGDFLIIEEPEAHLHPGNQRILAEALVKLVRAGIRILITTHSDYLLHQFSNFILMTSLANGPAELGYDSQDYLRADEVAAFLFAYDPALSGTTIRSLAVNDTNGIPDDEHAIVAEKIYDETVVIERSRIGTADVPQ